MLAEASASLNELIRKLAVGSVESRMNAAREIGVRLTGRRRSPRALIRSLADPYELVRIEAAESLGTIGDRKALPALWRAMRDRSALVRSYVAPAIGALAGRREMARIERRLREERSAIAKVGYYATLYHLGRHDVVSELMTLLSNRDYRVRCAAANTLGALATRSNARLIANALRSRLRQETTVAASSSLRSSLRAIRQRLGRVRCR